MFEDILENLRDATINVYFVLKIKKGIYQSYRLPNGLSNEVKNKYSENLTNFACGKTLGDYDFVHRDKTQIQSVSTNSVEVWHSILASINQAHIDGTLLNKMNFSDDYQMLVIDCAIAENGTIKHFYFIAKYIKINTWYKKGILAGFTADGLVEKKTDIIILNGGIDVVVDDSNIYILNDANFEALFNYCEAAKKVITDREIEIRSWPFMSNNEQFYESAISGKIKILNLANALKNSTTDWAAIHPTVMKAKLQADMRFSTIQFDVDDKIVCTKGNVDLIIDIIREVYSLQLFTNEIIQTKGV